MSGWLASEKVYPFVTRGDGLAPGRGRQWLAFLPQLIAKTLRLLFCLERATRRYAASPHLTLTVDAAPPTGCPARGPGFNGYRRG
jgi:hypothetical protein